MAGTTTLLLLAGAGLLLLKSMGGKSSNVGKTSDQERALLIEAPNGWLQYRPEYRGMLLQRLKVTYAQPSGGDDPNISVLIDAGQDVGELSGYALAANLHAAGYNVWVSPTLLSTTKQARWLYAASPAEGQPEPPATWKGKLVLLTSAYDEPFPGDLVGDVPPPPPNVPPPPPGA